MQPSVVYSESMSSTELERKGPAHRASVAEDAYDLVAKLVPAALATAANLLSAEKESVALEAAKLILSLGGVTSKVQVSVSEDSSLHREAEAQALALAQALERNKLGTPELSHTPSLETLVVLEDDPQGDPLPTVDPVKGALEATSWEASS